MVVGRRGRHIRNHPPHSPSLDHSPFRGLADLMRGFGLHRMDHAALVSLVLSVIHENRTDAGQMAGPGAAHADFCPDYHTCRLDWAHCWEGPPRTEKTPSHELLLANHVPQAFPGRPLLMDSRKGLRDNPPLLSKSTEGRWTPTGAQGHFLFPSSEQGTMHNSSEIKDFPPPSSAFGRVSSRLPWMPDSIFRCTAQWPPHPKPGQSM